MNKKTRHTAYRAGLAGERLAALWLMVKGYRIVGRRVRTPYGEVDLVARKKRVLVFVEVKYRRGGAGVDDIRPAQAARLVRAARSLGPRFDRAGELDYRFDVILLGGGRWPRHIRAAWIGDADGNNAIF